MTAHHEGACDMARDEVTDGQNPQAIEDQKAEMEQMLKRALSKHIPGPPQKRPTTSRSNQDLRKGKQHVEDNQGSVNGYGRHR